jgi:hypothetical protein
MSSAVVRDTNVLLRTRKYELKPDKYIAADLARCDVKYKQCVMLRTPNSRCDFTMARCMVEAMFLPLDAREITDHMDYDTRKHFIQEKPGYT